LTDSDLPRSFGKYLLTREFGRGAMGIVYEATDTEIHRTVALKLMRASDPTDAKSSALDDRLFAREVQTCSQLPKHPNIVNIYEAGAILGRRYIAMEPIDGVPLSEFSADLPTQVRILRDVALAVQFAHEGGILHRDLKPRNVLVDAEGRPRLTDFGTAKRINRSADSSSVGPWTVVGTPSYMSPEQARGLRDMDRRTDVYSLGAMLYEILTGKPPFPGDMTIVVLLRVVQDDIPAPSKVSEAWAHSPFDKSIEKACMKALSKRREDRHPTSLEFADELSRWLEKRSL
jgi:serine/threonine-protein kinase